MATAEPIEIPNCACGDRMKVAHHIERGDLFVCLNCDGLQPQEIGLMPKDRVSTPQDKAFEREMNRRIQEWYPGQDDKKKGKGKK